MRSALVSLVAGVLFYLVFVLRQSRIQRTSLDDWRDFTGIGFVASLALLPLVFWVTLGAGPGASGESIFERLFASTRWRYIWLPYAGIGAVAFTICAALHVVALKIAGRNGNDNDA
jgi:hypothetical protein